MDHLLHTLRYFLPLWIRRICVYGLPSTPSRDAHIFPNISVGFAHQLA